MVHVVFTFGAKYQGCKKTVKTDIMPKMNNVVIVDQVRGITILKNSLKEGTPSILHDSKMSLGILDIPAVNKMTS